ncbi:hypothetical protein ES703_111414 [subsurface metagenome]
MGPDNICDRDPWFCSSGIYGYNLERTLDPANIDSATIINLFNGHVHAGKSLLTLKKPKGGRHAKDNRFSRTYIMAWVSPKKNYGQQNTNNPYSLFHHYPSFTSGGSLYPKGVTREKS